MRIARTLLVAAFIAAPGLSLAEEQKTYRLTIGEVAVDINPGESLEVAMPDGKKVKVTLELNQFATHAGALFSFVHPTSIAVTQTEVDKTIQQHLMASALGTLVIVQEYSAINPVTLNELLLQELTRESVQAGGELTKQPATRKLSDGKELVGLKATVKMRTDESQYEVFSFGTADQGVVLVTRIDRENVPIEGAIIDKFWESLKITL
jgi:hypothetical protein